MPIDPRSAAAEAARGLLSSLSGLASPTRVRVSEVGGGLVCIIQLWDAATAMPTARVERAKPSSRRAGCREDILSVIRAAGKPLTRKELVRALREARAGHGPGTVAKALADLTTAGDLVNPKDKKGYRLAEWPKRPVTPSLFT